MKRAFGRLVVVVGAMGLFGAVSYAAGKPGDKEAEKLISAAMDNDYMASKFDAARAKLERATSSCAHRKCSAAVHATVYGYLAVVDGVGAKDMDKAKVDLKRMLEIDPNALLDEQFSNKDLRDAFAAMKKRPGGGAEGAESRAADAKSDEKAAKAEAARAAAQERQEAAARAREEAQKAADEKKDEQQKAVDEKKEAARQAAEEQQEAARQAAEAQQEAARQAAEAKKAAIEAKRVAAEEKKEAARKAAEDKKEALRKAEEERKAELARKAEEARKAAEEKRLRAPVPVGEMTGTVWKEAVVSYPLPVFAKLPPPPAGIEPVRVKVVRVVVTFSSPMVAVPTTVDMKMVEEGSYAIMIPCEATKQEGDVLYNVSAFNKFDVLVAKSGTIEKPHKVALKGFITAALPHLPGEVPPEACGAKSAASQKGKCTENFDCEYGEVCANGKCAAGESPLLAKAKNKKGSCASCDVGAAGAPTLAETLFGAALFAAAFARRRGRSK